MKIFRSHLLMALLALAACKQPTTYDVVIRGGTLYDGSGSGSVKADLAIQGDTIAAIGDLSGVKGKTEVDATGLAVAPGFVNMMSHAEQSLLLDGRSMADLKQGVTFEVLAESSMGPWSERMKEDDRSRMGRSPELSYEIDWTTLGEYFTSLEKRGITPNVASFVGLNTIRIHEIGYANRAATPEEMERMKALMKQAMEDGAMGGTTMLIYAPSSFASTEELIELMKVASPYGGMYISHMRSEGVKIFEAVDESLRIGREANVPVEIYHLKMAGKSNWWKLDSVISKITTAHAQGMKVTADMYNYTAGATGLDATMPTWVQEGGISGWVKRLKDPAIRKKVAAEMRDPNSQWENFLQAAGPEGILLLGFTRPSMKQYAGLTLAEVSKKLGMSPEETAIELVIRDSTRVETAYFLMSEENVKKQIALPFVSFGSDEGSPADEEPYNKELCHPRAYGNVARLLGKYVRDEKVISLEEAVRRLTSLPLQNMGVKYRGMLQTGYFADVVVFDPATIQDHATFEDPHQYSTGVSHVWVNGMQVLKDGNHTGAKPGRAIRKGKDEKKKQ